MKPTKHTNGYKKVETMTEAINFLLSLGYTENKKSDLQILGYTDGSLGFTKDMFYASCNPCLHGGVSILY
jgi:hypothetical protein